MNENNKTLKGFTYNNLGVACWWHKFPNFREFPESSESEEED